MDETSEPHTVEFLDVDGRRVGRASGPWDDAQPSRIAMSLLGATSSDDPLRDVPRVRIFEAGHDPERWWVWFEAFPGVDLLDLRHLLAPSPSPALAASIVARIATALGGHRGLHHVVGQPEWVLFSPAGEARFVLLATCYIEGLCGPLVGPTVSFRVWRELAPERLLADPSGVEDVYELGLTLAELAAGVRPLLEAPDVASLKSAVQRKTPLSRLVSLPRDLREVVDAATDPSPGARPSLVELARALAPLGDDDELLRLLAGARRIERGGLPPHFCDAPDRA